MKRLALVSLLLLILLAACHARPIQVGGAPEAKLPPIPAAYVSQLGLVPVVWMDSLTDGEGHGLYGGFSAQNRTIYLNRIMKHPVQAWMTYLHETCHVNAFDSGLRQIVDPRLMQSVCDVWAASELRGMLQRGGR